MPDPATVLIVEDDSFKVDFMSKGLRASGFDVESVATAGEAKARIEAGGVDVQVLDLGLPNVDGLARLRLLADRGALVPTVVVTARSFTEDRTEALAVGARHYLTKPFVWSDLLASVQESCSITVDSGSPRAVDGEKPSTVNGKVAGN